MAEDFSAAPLGATRGAELAGVGVINAPIGDLPQFEAAANNPQVPARFPAPWAADARVLSKDLASAGITYGEIPKVCLQKAVERIGLEWLSFVRKHSRVLTLA